MGFWSNIAARFRKKKNPVNPAILAGVGGRVVWSKRNFETFAEEGYRINPVAYACIREQATAVGGIPWLVMKRGQGPNGKSVELPDHALAELLRRPNMKTGGAQFFQNFTGYHELHGNCYTTVAGPKGKPPVELWQLRPDKTRIVKGDRKQPVRGYEYGDSEPGIPLDTEKVLHVKYWNPTDDWYGMSPMEAAARSIDTHNEASRWNMNRVQNDGRPSGLMSFPGELSDTQFDRVQEQIQDNVKGGDNAGMVLTLEGGGGWTSMGMTASELDWLEGKKLSGREICIVYNTPPELIGDSESKTYANYKEARKAFYVENILPRMDVYRDDLANWLVPMFEEQGLILDYDRDAIEALQDERQMIFDMATSAFREGLIGRGEARELMGYPTEIPTEDLVVMPSGAVPVQGHDLLQLPEADEEEEVDPVVDEVDEGEETDEKFLRLVDSVEKLGELA